MMVLQTSPLPLGYHSKRLLKYNKYQVLCQSGQTHYKQKTEFLAPSHGCVIQNRTIMRYTLFVIEATLALSVLIIQCLTYISLLGTNERAELKVSYFVDFAFYCVFCLYCFWRYPNSKKTGSSFFDFLSSFCFDFLV